MTTTNFFDDGEHPTPKQEVMGDALIGMVSSANRLIGLGAGSGKSWVWARFVRFLYRTDTGVRDAVRGGLLQMPHGDPTNLRASVAEDWPVTNRTRRIGWFDQRGRVYVDIPTGENRPPDVGSFTPLLIEIDD